MPDRGRDQWRKIPMEITAGTDPFALFQSWFDEAVKTEINDPDAIALASVDVSGMPSVRMVLLRRWSPNGFLFFTNYESRKSDELLATGSRGRGSQIGAWASAQSRPLVSRAALEAEVKAVGTQFPAVVERPPHWGGFCLKPQEIEFWHDGEHRLHDRFRFLIQANGGWDIQRLNP
jgi:pyridoxamine 5'-phosphate oxidase